MTHPAPPWTKLPPTMYQLFPNPVIIVPTLTSPLASVRIEMAGNTERIGFIVDPLHVYRRSTTTDRSTTDVSTPHMSLFLLIFFNSLGSAFDYFFIPKSRLLLYLTIILVCVRTADSRGCDRLASGSTDDSRPRSGPAIANYIRPVRANRGTLKIDQLY